MRTIDIFHFNFPKFRYIKTDKETSARADGIVMKEDKLFALVESKGRSMPLQQLQTEYNNKWLVTASKIDKLIDMAYGLHVSVYGFLYLRPNDLLLAKTIFDIKTGELVKMEKRETTTQATCNGGTTQRLNYFIDMSAAKQYSAPNPKAHLCSICGSMAYFGHGVNLRAAHPGQWFCREHRPKNIA
jgi:hypothetical protein